MCRYVSNDLKSGDLKIPQCVPGRTLEKNAQTLFPAELSGL